MGGYSEGVGWWTFGERLRSIWYMAIGSKTASAGAVSMLCPAVRQGAINGILPYMPVFLSLAS